jgi:hypothetical protein
VTTLRNVTLFALEATIQYCRVSIQNKLRLGTATHWHCAPTSLREFDRLLSKVTIALAHKDMFRTRELIGIIEAFTGKTSYRDICL